jgi:hypothetical protein
MTASATFVLNAGVWCRCARQLIVSPGSRVNLGRREEETPLTALFRFPAPALQFAKCRVRPQRHHEELSLGLFAFVIIVFGCLTARGSTAPAGVSHRAARAQASAM